MLSLSVGRGSLSRVHRGPSALRPGGPIGSATTGRTALRWWPRRRQAQHLETVEPIRGIMLTKPRYAKVKDVPSATVRVTAIEKQHSRRPGPARLRNRDSYR